MSEKAKGQAGAASRSERRASPRGEAQRSTLRPFLLRLDLATGVCEHDEEDDVEQKLTQYTTDWWNGWKDRQEGPLPQQRVVLHGWVACPRRGIPQESVGAVRGALAVALNRVSRGERSVEQLGEEDCCAIRCRLADREQPLAIELLKPSPTPEAGATEAREAAEEEYRPDVLPGTAVPTTLPMVEEIVGQLTGLNEDIDEALRGPMRSLEAICALAKGRNFQSLEANQRIASLIQKTADRLGVLFACPRCGEPSRFRCSENKTSKTGVFVFSHGRQTHGGSTTVPTLVPTGGSDSGLVTSDSTKSEKSEN